MLKIEKQIDWKSEYPKSWYLFQIPIRFFSEKSEIGNSEFGSENMVPKLELIRSESPKIGNSVPIYTPSFDKSNYDSCVYQNGSFEEDQLLLLLYVDDMFIIGKNLQAIKNLKAKLKGEFEMKDMGHASRIPGIDITRNRNRNYILLTQRDYLTRVLQKFGTIDAKAVLTPLTAHFKLSTSQRPQTTKELEYIEGVPYANVVGSVMYSMVNKARLGLWLKYFE